MIALYAGATIVIGMVLGTRMGPQSVLRAVAWLVLAASGAGAFLWREEPFARLVDLLGYYYAVLTFGLFYGSFGVLLGMLFRAAGASSDSRSPM